MKGLILAGGSGTRLRPLTHTGPKPLRPRANTPNILYCLEDIRDAGVTVIGIILGNNMPKKVRELLGDGSDFGVKITYIVQGEPRGIAHAVGCAREFMGDEPFVVYLGDNILTGGIKFMVDEFLVSDDEAMVALCQVSNPQQFGIAELDDDGHIISLVEKPKEPRSDLAMIGIYLLRSSVFPVIDRLKPSWRNELEITDAIDTLRQEVGNVTAKQVRGWWKDTGKPSDILAANRLVLDDMKPDVLGTIEDGARIEGRVSIGKGTIVRDGAVICGPAIVGRDCDIGPTYIGPYTSIGNGCRLAGGELGSSIIMDGCHIECDQNIVDSLIGGNTTILSENDRKPRGIRLVVGENCSVGL